MKLERQEVINTGGIPQCPYCKKPTKRTGGGGSVTCVYYPPIYNEQGINTNPDRNIRTSGWECLECKKHYATVGNSTNGFYYNTLEETIKSEQ